MKEKLIHLLGGETKNESLNNWLEDKLEEQLKIKPKTKDIEIFDYFNDMEHAGTYLIEINFRR